MKSSKFLVIDNCKKRSRKGKPFLGILVDRQPFRGDLIQKIFGWVHARASHGLCNKNWKRAETRLYKRYCMAPYKMIMLGIKKERL